jgi:hypothetical protein
MIGGPDWPWQLCQVNHRNGANEQPGREKRESPACDDDDPLAALNSRRRVQ